MAHNNSETENQAHPTTLRTRPRKQRPSRARGLRGITGCVTCRSRRVKCDEQRPRCGQCNKSDRECTFAEPKPPRRRKSRATDSPQSGTSFAHNKVALEPGIHGEDPILRVSDHVTDTAATTLGRTQTIQDQDDSEIEAASIPVVHSPGLQRTTLTGPIIGFGYNSASELGCSPSALLYDNNASAVDWFDLLAQDAINNLQRVNSLDGVVQWNFDENSLSRRQSPGPALPNSDLQPVEKTNINTLSHHQPSVISTPWNSKPRIQIDASESIYLHYYTTVVGPIFDLLDPARHFSDTVTHLAMHNTGLLRSIIAVAARHMALQGFDHLTDVGQCSLRLNREETALTTRHVATQNYYETLQYVSQNMMYASYQESPEILGTAILLSAYEMFDSDNTASAGNWERHLRGSFWIQRTQENNGEMAEGLRRATWWAWLRQDIWAAFREGRRTMTFFKARRKPEELTADELVNRVFLIAARCVNYHADSNTQSDVLKRLQKGEELFEELEHWHSVLPSSFKPIAIGGSSATATTVNLDNLSTTSAIESTASLDSLDCIFPSMWIHPPAYAAAIQMFHVCRILIVLNQPSSGGRSEYVKRQKMLQGSVMSICGISNTRQGKDLPSPLVNAQALYIAGLCVEGVEKRTALLRILSETLEITKFPPRNLADDLAKLWD